jgi:hypothetical protein
MTAAPHRAMASATPFTVDVASREEVRQFYRSIYNASESVPMGWTGNYTAASAVTAAGDTSAAFKEAVRVRINFFRALVGVPAGIAFDAAYSAKDQQAALMMSANNGLSHFPPTNWTYYTADGALAAQNSNLAVGNSGPDAITGYMIDNAGGTDPTNNAPVGHRRWLYYPQTLLMGTGDVPGNSTHYSANVTWVIDGQVNGSRPATRTTHVPYPPAGYVPYQLVWPRWSFSYPSANFSSATVTMTRGGTSVPVTLETVSTGSGENALVWLYDGQSSFSPAPHAKPGSDTTYTVNVSNVLIGGNPQSFSYTVKVFDPDAPGADYAPATVSLPATIPAGQATAYTLTVPSFASHQEFRPLQFAAFSKNYNAENGLDGIVTDISGYPPVVTDTVGAGTASYHLAKPNISVLRETLTLPETFYAANSSASLSFLSRLGYATANQIAHVQIALDDGTGWFDLAAQPGTSSESHNAPTETTFSTHTISLAAYAGRTFRLRFAYTYSGDGLYYPDVSSGVGWYLDNIALTGVQTATAGASAVATRGSAGTFTAATAGTIGVQARGLFFGTYPMEWGPVSAITVNNGPAITAQPQGHTIATGSTVVFSVEATGTGLTYQWKKNGVNIPNATSARFILSNAQAADAASYTVAVGNGSATTTSTAAALTVAASSNPGRIFNLSIRGTSGTGNKVLIMGFVTGGDGTGGSTSLLIRGVGPSIIPAPYFVTDALPDPAIQVIPAGSGTAIAANDDWGGTAQLKAAATATGAFALASDTSKDAALLANLPRNLYSVIVSGNAATTGSVLAEIYDASAGSFNAATPRLVNISARAFVGGSDNLIAGFVIVGDTAKTVLIRAIGPDPTFAANVGNANLGDPSLALYHAHNGTNELVLTNDNWGGDPQLTSVGNSVGAAVLSNPASKDAVVLVTLDPGVYSALDLGVNGTTGITLIEVYEVN